ncbi:hypothetical protein AAMO2058_001441600 [Amorphochlora amoebiformis]
MADVKRSSISPSPSPAVVEAAEDTTLHLEQYDIKGHPTLPPESYLPKAFGRWSFEEIGDVLDQKHPLRDQGIDMLYQMLRTPTNTIRACQYGLLEKLDENLDNPTTFDCILQFVRQWSCRLRLMKKTQILHSLVDVAENGDIECRLGAYMCLNVLAQHQGMSGEHRYLIVDRCIKSCANDRQPSVKQSALEVLQLMILRQGVYTHGETCVPVVTSLLDHVDSEVRCAACKALQAVTVTSTGKASCIKSGSVEKFVRNLEDKNKKVRLFSAASLSQISNLKAGKQAIVEAKGVSILLDKLSDEPAIINYSLQCLTNMFENETVRLGAVECDDNRRVLKELTESKDTIIAKSAQSAMDKLLWLP